MSPVAEAETLPATPVPVPPKAHVAVVDVGSNSIRIVVYDRLCRAPVPRFNEKSLCGLGRGLDERGHLDRHAADCALHILTRFTRLAEAMNAAHVVITATEALRRADDGADFLKTAEARIGRRIRVLSGDDEARLSALGVAHGFWQPDGIVADLGGGSIEFAFVDNIGLDGRRASLPLGTLRLQPHATRDRTLALGRIDGAVETVPWLRGAARGRSFYVVGGGWRALARVHLAMTDAPLKVAHGYAIAPETALKLTRDLLELDRKGLAKLAGMPKRRVDTLPAAALLFQRVIERLEPERIVFSALGLREGLLFSELEPDELAKDPLIEGARDLGLQRSRAPGIGDAVAAWTALLFAGEEPAAARMRLAACLVSDVGWLETRDSRARDAFFALAHYPFLGVGHVERVFIAYAIFLRYEGDPDDKPVRALLTVLSDEERRRAEILGRALQVAYRLSGGAPGLLDGTGLLEKKGELRLEIPDLALVPELDSLKSRLRELAHTLRLSRMRVVTP